jgi:hypothetical protein
MQYSVKNLKSSIVNRYSLIVRGHWGKMEDGSQKSEVGSRKKEVGSQKTVQPATIIILQQKKIPEVAPRYFS